MYLNDEVNFGTRDGIGSYSVECNVYLSEMNLYAVKLNYGFLLLYDESFVFLCIKQKKT